MDNNMFCLHTRLGLVTNKGNTGHKEYFERLDYQNLVFQSLIFCSIEFSTKEEKQLPKTK